MRPKIIRTKSLNDLYFQIKSWIKSCAQLSNFYNEVIMSKKRIRCLDTNTSQRLRFWFIVSIHFEQNVFDKTHDWERSFITITKLNHLKDFYALLMEIN